MKNVGLSVKYVLLTDKSAKKGTLSVNLSEILACLLEQEKIRTNHGTDLNHYSVERSAPHLYNRVHDRSLPHLVIIRFRLTTPLSQAPLLGQDELTRRKRNLDTRGLSVRLRTLPVKHTLDCTPCNHEDIGLVNGFIGLGLELD